MNIELTILKKFREVLIEFLDSLIEQLDKHPEAKGELITLRIFTKDQMPIVDIMNNFILYILPHKEKITQREDTFFVEQVDKFTKLPKSSVERFKLIWRSNTFNKDDITIIWKFIDVLVKLGEKFQMIKIKKNK